MSEEKNKQDKEESRNDELQTEFSDIKKIENYSSPEVPSCDVPEIRCPLCPKFAKITINHIKNEIISECPDNHYMKLDFLSFVEKSTDHPIYCTKCSICNNTGKTNSFCLECNKYFCTECLEKHNKNDLPSNNGGVYSNILLRNNSLENNGNSKMNPDSSNLNTSFPNHLTTLNLANNNNSLINTVQHHVININEQDNQCAIHQKEKFVAFCLKCNKSFCQKCLEEITKGLKNNLNSLSCGKFGNLHHGIKKIKDIVGEKKLNKIKQSLNKEVEILNYIENQSNMIIEQILEKVNNLREIHLLKEQLYNLYLLNQENASLVKTINELGNSFTLQTGQFNTSEKLLNNLEIINVKLPHDKKEDKKIEIKINDMNINNNNIENNLEEAKKQDIIASKIDKKNELKKLKEEKKKQIQKMKEDKKNELKKKKEELKKIKQQKKKEAQQKTKENSKNKDKDKEKGETKKGDNEEVPPSQNVNDNNENNNDNDNKDLNNGNSNP